MALRDQPYLPLYVQDYLTDERLNMCSWATQGIYIKIMCVLHKQEQYGSILLKQNSKQNLSNIEYFASVFVKNLPCQLPDMIAALTELVDNGVLIIDDAGLHQKRMKKDGETSLKRSKAAKSGGGNPVLFKQKSKQTDKQNTEYEYEIENEIVIENKKGGVGENNILSDESLATIFDDAYLDPLPLAFRGIDIKAELEKFKIKIRGAPADYEHRDTAGIRNAFLYQLRTARTNTNNGKPTSTNKHQQHTASLVKAYAETYGPAFTGGANGQSK